MPETNAPAAEADLAHAAAADVFNATLVHRQALNPALHVLRVKPDVGLAPQFHPGQFAMLGLPRLEEPKSPDSPVEAGPHLEAKPEAEPITAELSTADAAVPARPRSKPKLVRRAYSISSPATVREHLEFVITLVEGGQFTPRLWEIPVGGRVWMDTKVAGHFTLDGVPEGSDLVFVSTGTGLAPFVSMLMTYLSQPTWRRVVVFNGVRASADLAYRAELEAVCAKHPEVQYFPSVTREPEGTGYTGLRGRLPALLEPGRFRDLTGFDLTPERTHVYLCGNPAMIDDVQKMLEPRGFKTHSKRDPGNLHFERYW